MTEASRTHNLAHNLPPPPLNPPTCRLTETQATQDPETRPQVPQAAHHRSPLHLDGDHLLDHLVTHHRYLGGETVGGNRVMMN